MIDEYKKILILLYFLETGASYSYNELLVNFGFQNKQLDYVLAQLVKENYLIIDGHLKLSEEGNRILSEHGLLDFKFDYTEEDEIFIEEPMNILDIYIPKKFKSKYK